MTNILHQVGEALHGSRWQTALARDLGISPRYMRHLVKEGKEPVDFNCNAQELIANKMLEIRIVWNALENPTA